MARGEFPKSKRENGDAIIQAAMLATMVPRAGNPVWARRRKLLFILEVMLRGFMLDRRNRETLPSDPEKSDDPRQLTRLL